MSDTELTVEEAVELLDTGDFEVGSQSYKELLAVLEKDSPEEARVREKEDTKKEKQRLAKEAKREKVATKAKRKAKTKTTKKADPDVVTQVVELPRDVADNDEIREAEGRTTKSGGATAPKGISKEDALSAIADKLPKPTRTRAPAKPMSRTEADQAILDRTSTETRYVGEQNNWNAGVPDPAAQPTLYSTVNSELPSDGLARLEEYERDMAPRGGLSYEQVNLHQRRLYGVLLVILRDDVNFQSRFTHLLNRFNSSPCYQTIYTHRGLTQDNFFPRWLGRMYHLMEVASDPITRQNVHQHLDITAVVAGMPAPQAMKILNYFTG